jgi:hypothetical protein
MNQQQDPTLAGATNTSDVSQFQKEAEERKDASPGEQAAGVMSGEPGLDAERKLAEEASDDG